MKQLEIRCYEDAEGMLFLKDISKQRFLLFYLRLCDWSKLAEMTRQQQAALGKRYQAVKRAQERIADKNKRAERHGIDLLITEREEKLNAQVA